MMMSLGLYSNVWLRLIIIGIQVYSKRVNMRILGGVPSFHQNLSRYMYQFSHLLVLQLLSYMSSRRRRRRRRKTTWTKWENYF